MNGSDGDEDVVDVYNIDFLFQNVDFQRWLNAWSERLQDERKELVPLK